MKVVILAAGKGSRLGQKDLPKPLTHLITGESILHHQVEMLRKYVSVNDIYLVIGYQKEKIIEAFPELHHILSLNFENENTSKSLLKAIMLMDDDLIWLNGDVVFHHSILGSLLENAKTGMIVNIGAVDEEGVKYSQDEQGLITEVSKRVKFPLGEALGINYCSKEDLKLLKQKLVLCDPNDYFEKAIELCIEEGMKVCSVPVSAGLCVEVDFREDLKKANQMILNWRPLA